MATPVKTANDVYLAPLGACTQMNLVVTGNVIFLMNTVATTLVADDLLFG
jgi:hypothetical protein